MKKVQTKRLLSSLLALLMFFNTFSFSYAQNGNKDGMIKPETKKALLETADRLLKRRELTSRFLGTNFLHSPIDLPGYSPSNDLSEIPETAIVNTAWYSIWKVAHESKVMIDSFTEKLGQSKLNELRYYEALYGFPMSRRLQQDGFYQGDFRVFDMKFAGGEEAVQAFYLKQGENAKARALLKEIGIFKEGNNLDINLSVDKSKVRSIENVFVNNIATIRPETLLGPKDGEKNLISISVPGEVGAENLVITSMNYIDQEGQKQKIGPIGIEIDYSALQKDNYKIPDYDELINTKLEIWLARGERIKLYCEGDPKNAHKVKSIEKGIKHLQEAKNLTGLSLGDIYEYAEPIYTAENEVTLQDILKKGIDLQKETLTSGFYSEKKYTKESLEQYAKFLSDTEKNMFTLSLSDLVQKNVTLEKATLNIILRFNTKALENLISIAENKKIQDYTEQSLVAFLAAKTEAKAWVLKNKNYRPSIDQTDTHISALLKATNALIRKDGGKEAPIKIDDLYGDKKPTPPAQEKIYTVPGTFGRFQNWNDPSEYNSMLNPKVKLIDDGSGKSKLVVYLQPKVDDSKQPTAAITALHYNFKGKMSPAKVLETKIVQFADGQNSSKSIESAAAVELLNIDPEKKTPMQLRLDIYSKKKGRMESDDVFLRLDFQNKKEGYEGDSPSQPDNKAKDYTVNVRFVNAKNTNKESHANATLTQRAKLQVLGNQQTLTLRLKPMINSDKQPSGVITDLFYYNGSQKIATRKLAQANIDITYKGKTVNYVYPTSVQLPVDGQSKHIRCYILSGTPVFDEPHGDDVVLEIDYQSKTEGFNENEVNKEQLIQLSTLLNSPYYQGYKSILPTELTKKLESELTNAQKIIANTHATKEQVEQSTKQLENLKDVIDFYIIQHRTYLDVEANLKSDIQSKKYTKESIQVAEKFISETKNEIKQFIAQPGFSINEAKQKLNRLSNYYQLLRYDVSELEREIETAKSKLDSKKYTADSLAKLREEIEKATEYAQKAKNTRAIQDKRAELIQALQKAVASLQEKQQAIDTALLEQKIATAQEKIQSGKYTSQSTDALNQVVKKALLYIENVRSGMETADKTAELIKELDEAMGQLVEKEKPQPRVIKADLEAKFQKPGGGNTMANRFFKPPIAKVSYDTQSDITVYEFGFDISAIVSTNAIENDKTEFVLADSETTRKEMATDSLAVTSSEVEKIDENTAQTADEKAVVETPANPTADKKDEAIRLEAHSENTAIPTGKKEPIQFWYKNGNDYLPVELVENNKGKMLFRFSKEGKVSSRIAMRVYIDIMSATHDVELAIKVPDDFYEIKPEEQIRIAREALAQSIETAKQLSADKYEKASFDAMLNALKVAETVAKNDKADVKALQEAKAQLDQAVKALVPKKQSDDIRIAREALAQSIASAKQLDADKYEKASFDAMLNALKAAEAVVQNDKADVKALQEAKAQLDQAVKSLVPKKQSDDIRIAREALAQSISSAKQLNADKYEKASFDAMLNALKAAEAVAKNDKADVKALQEAKAQLDQAVKALKKRNTNSGGSGSGGSGGGGVRSSSSAPRTSTPAKQEEIKNPSVPLATMESKTVSVLTIGSKNYTVAKDGKTEQKMLDVAPMIHKGRTMLPARVIAQLLDMDVIYNNATKTAKFVFRKEENGNQQEHIVELTLGKKTLTVDGKVQALSGETINKNGRILMPISDIQKTAKSLGLPAQITWEGQSKQVTISK